MAGFDKESQRGRARCDWDLCFLEWPRAQETPGYITTEILSIKHNYTDIAEIIVLYENSFVQYYFEGNYDVIRFLKEVQKAGLYAILRIGPYVCAEWNYGYICESFFKKK